MLRGRFTEIFFPARLSADPLGITLVKVEFWLTPWTRQDEHLPMSHLAEVAHERGLIWDSISIESSGGLNPLSVDKNRCWSDSIRSNYSSSDEGLETQNISSLND